MPSIDIIPTRSPNKGMRLKFRILCFLFAGLLTHTLVPSLAQALDSQYFWQAPDGLFMFTPKFYVNYQQLTWGPQTNYEQSIGRKYGAEATFERGLSPNMSFGFYGSTAYSEMFVSSPTTFNEYYTTEIDRVGGMIKAQTLGDDDSFHLSARGNAMMSTKLSMQGEGGHTFLVTAGYQRILDQGIVGVNLIIDALRMPRKRAFLSGGEVEYSGGLTQKLEFVFEKPYPAWTFGAAFGVAQKLAETTKVDGVKTANGSNYRIGTLKFYSVSNFSEGIELLLDLEAQYLLETLRDQREIQRDMDTTLSLGLRWGLM